jgi:hypothetical protein
VTPSEAGRLFALLRAAYPDAKAKIGPDTADLWLEELRRLEATSGETAVRSLIESSRFWPSIAELREQYAVAREQLAREFRAEERRTAERVADQIERPPLREIPAVRDYLERRAPGVGLPEEGAGVCSDCERQRPRLYRFGKVRVCAEDARSRLRTREKVEAAAERQEGDTR